MLPLHHPRIVIDGQRPLRGAARGCPASVAPRHGLTDQEAPQAHAQEEAQEAAEEDALAAPQQASNRPTRRSSPLLRADPPRSSPRSLQITGVRADGFHLIDAEMSTIACSDEIELSPSGARSLVVHADTGEHLDIGPPEREPAARALLAVDRDGGITVRKRIPAGAGLGGGSADAARGAALGGWTGTSRRVQAGGPTGGRRAVLPGRGRGPG